METLPEYDSVVTRSQLSDWSDGRNGQSGLETILLSR